ncbi:MAG: RNA 2',3'-cyclic phosphodiesterase [Verrucomicrobiota bacterium]|jgi:2'-5' RNA ligase
MADDSSTEKLRLFVAIPMPEAIRNEIIGVQQEFQRLVPREAVRWTKPEQFHLTLRFLGDVPVGRVADLQKAVNAVCAGEPALRLRAQGVGFFPNARLPRVLWAGVNDGEGRLADLQKRIESVVQPFTQEPGADRFAGHVTIGRVKSLKRPEIEKLAAQAQSVKDRLLGEWTANEIEIIQSRLSPAGAQHSLLTAICLKV